MERAQSPYAVSRVVAGALPAGVVALWVVGWILTGGGREGMSPEALPPTLALWGWAAVAMGGFAGALAFRGRALHEARALRGQAAEEARPEVARRVLTSLIVAWALLEGPALLSGILFVLLGAAQILVLAVPFYLVGVALTFPRREWFGETRGRGAGG